MVPVQTLWSELVGYLAFAYDNVVVLIQDQGLCVSLDSLISFTSLQSLRSLKI